MSFTTHLSILEGMKEDRESCWERFYRTYAPLIRLHGKDCGIRADNMEDLVQNVMITVSSQIHRFTYRSDLGHFRHFLRKIIRARSMDMLRTLYRHEMTLPEMGQEAVLDDQFEEEWRDHIRQVSLALLKKSISARHYQIFDLLDIQQVRVRDVARLYKLPEATIYSIRNRTEEKLRAIVKNQDF